MTCRHMEVNNEAALLGFQIVGPGTTERVEACLRLSNRFCCPADSAGFHVTIIRPKRTHLAASSSSFPPPQVPRIITTPFHPTPSHSRNPSLNDLHHLLLPPISITAPSPSRAPITHSPTTIYKSIGQLREPHHNIISHTSTTIHHVGPRYG